MAVVELGLSEASKVSRLFLASQSIFLSLWQLPSCFGLTVGKWAVYL